MDSDFTDSPSPITRHPSPTLFPVRHHGPGSARALLAELERERPDLILIEGPADGSEMLSWLGREEMEPPVAMLVYRPDNPQRAGYFPYTVFSPEYQAIRFGLRHNIPVRLFDLPQAVMLAAPFGPEMPSRQPFELLAQATGFRSYESWWNNTIEQRQRPDSRDLFQGILELMATLRETADQQPPAADEVVSPEKFTERLVKRQLADQREAHMRQEIRRGIEEGYHRIAVICGAWHAPALRQFNRPERLKEDQQLLSDLPHVAVEMAWVPWTYGRLASFSGYGAGVNSPGWYHHLWESGQKGYSPTEAIGTWLSHITQLLREEGFDASAAHVIEALRLAESLAALRDIPLPGLPELNEVTRSVICAGDEQPMQIIQRRLIVGERMGMVPPDAPLVPLQRDLYRQMRELKLRPEIEESKLKLDLRLALHLNRSQLLHRLNLLNITWGKIIKPRGGGEGTFTEMWQLKWRPDFALRMVEANLWGNTVEDAATALTADRAEKADQLPALTRLLDEVILADLPRAVEKILYKIQEISALNRDILHMMNALPPLARIMRYGDIRQTDQTLVQKVVETLLTRICVGLPSSCQRLDDQAAQQMIEAIIAVHGAVATLTNTDQIENWYDTLSDICNSKGVHGTVAGRLCRMLFEGGRLTIEQTVARLESALSPAYAQTFVLDRVQQAAAWLDGFLSGANLLLIHDLQLWEVIDRWITRLAGDRFEAIVPFLRRTFHTLSEATRRQLAERVYAVAITEEERPLEATFDRAAAEAMLPALGSFLGVN